MKPAAKNALSAAEALERALQPMEAILNDAEEKLCGMARAAITVQLTYLQARFPSRTIWYDDQQDIRGWTVGIDWIDVWDRPTLRALEELMRLLGPLQVTLDRLRVCAGYVVIPARRPRIGTKTLTVDKLEANRSWAVRYYQGRPIAQHIPWALFPHERKRHRAPWHFIELRDERDADRFQALIVSQEKGEY